MISQRFLITNIQKRGGKRTHFIEKQAREIIYFTYPVQNISSYKATGRRELMGTQSSQIAGVKIAAKCIILVYGC
jgi:hypothetical protein